MTTNNYLRPYYSEMFNFIPKSCEKLNEIANNIKNANNLKRLVAACTAMKYGEHLFKLFMNRVAALNEEKIKLLYDNFRNQVTEEDVKAPAEIVEELKKTSFLNMMADRGYLLVKGVFKFNSNIFARHFLERTDLIALNDTDIGIYNKKGYYERVNAESLVLGKIAHVIMNEIKGWDMWNSFDEKEGIKAIQRSTKLIKDLEVDRNLINLNNGILNLTTYKLNNHSP